MKPFQVLKLVGQVEPLIVSGFGAESLKMAKFLSIKGECLRELKQTENAIAAYLTLKLILEKTSFLERYDFYNGAVFALAKLYTSIQRHDLVVQCLDTAMPYLGDNSLFLPILNHHSASLAQVGRLPEAYASRMQHMTLTLSEYGSESADFAESIMRLAFLLMALNQPGRAAVELERCLELYRKIDPSNPDIATARNFLAMCPDGIWAAGEEKRWVETKYRLCSFPDCTTVEEKMKRCSSCKNLYYLCTQHEKKALKHTVRCPNYPDALWVERNLDRIVKCRRCRKKVPLGACRACIDVWYCGYECHEADWGRHQKFCGKNE